MTHLRTLVVLGATATIAATIVQVPRAQRAAPPPAAVVDQYCTGCHNPRTNAGELTLDPAALADIPAAAPVWEKVLRKVRAGAMPPPGLPRPDPATRRTFVSLVEDALDRASAVAPNPGRPAMARLNRTEYGNAVRDLLHFEVDTAALLPPDDSTGGFDNNADLLSISPVLLERYLAAAARISAVAVGSRTIGAGSETYRVRGDASQTGHVEGLPLGTRGGIVARHTFPLDGEYVITVKLLETNMGAIRGLEEQHHVEMTIDGRRIFLAPVGGEEDFRMSANNATDMVNELDARLSVRVLVEAGPREVGATFLQRTSAQGGTRLQAFERSTIDAMHHGGLPHVASVTVAGPFNPTGPGDTPSRRRIFTCRPSQELSEDACAERIVATLARRAYRRPATRLEMERLMALYHTGRSDAGFEPGIETALRGILANPKFLLRAEPELERADSGAIQRIGDIELASRLSFFLWSSIPDDRLVELALAGRLSTPAVLEQQVRRMLADPRAQSLVTDFAAQWLQLRNLRSAAPDKNLYPDFDDNLRQAFLRETEMFLGSFLAENRSVLELLTARDTFLNERLARHYRVAGIRGSHFRRVALERPERHGLLGHGSILLLTSHADRTSPVARGKWVLENIIGVPPPPPPPDVPPLEPHTAAAPQSMRARMELHRRNPACASCHRLMDPIGLALENFDAVGAWRTRESDMPIDASGELMDGTPVDGPVALREALVGAPDVFVGHVAERLLTYALQRRLEYYDMPVVRSIVRDAAAADYRLSSLVMGVVNSPPFQLRRLDQ